LTRLLPSLKTIGVLIPHLNTHEGVWEYIFPENTKSGEAGEFCEIGNLVVSLNAECDSSQVARLLRIFPNLKILRHIRERRKWEGLGCCEHKKKEEGEEWEYYFKEESLVEYIEVPNCRAGLSKYSESMRYQMGKPNLTIQPQFFDDWFNV
jgi:hypothetical protein